MIKTKIVKIDPSSPEFYLINEAAEVLKSGGLVIIPTETVYGIAANKLNKDAINRLYEIKNRPQDKPFSIHIERKDRIEEFARAVPVCAYKLIDKFWPGPLTLILKSKDTGKVGLRMPDNEIALKVIEEAGIPIACPSANISGRNAPVTFQEAIKDLEGLVELAVDAGNTRLAAESSVVDLTVEPIKIVRLGAIKKEEIEAVAKNKTVLFICSGNSCRSVMAQALLKKVLKEKNRADVEVLSAGTLILSGLGVTEGTKEVLRREGIDASAHRSQRVTKEMIKKSDIILVMEKQHEERILSLAPEVKNRLFLLKEFAKINDNNLNIVDPIGKPLEFYEKTFQVIKEAVERISNII
ncbi:MAG: L-threonylcarbamoyladenylate synthase [Candidatus Omnitrophica bacterium]|nr:L-threonylcarbamoyladenylate synthase [Candidatus Omnitrophota bacterium]